MNKIKLIGLGVIALTSLLLTGCPGISTGMTANLVATPTSVVFESVNSAPKLVVLTNKKGTFQGTVTRLYVGNGGGLTQFTVESNTCNTESDEGTLKPGDSCSFWIKTNSDTTSSSNETLSIFYAGSMSSDDLEIPVSVNSNPQPVPQPSEYSDDLPAGGQLASFSNLYLSSTSPASTLYFYVSEGVLKPVVINFAISSTSGSGVLPTLSRSSCILAYDMPDQYDEGCNINLNLVGALAGSYLITPSVDGVQLSPVQITSQEPSTVTLPSGKYLISATMVGPSVTDGCAFIDDAGKEQKKFESTQVKKSFNIKLFSAIVF